MRLSRWLCPPAPTRAALRSPAPTRAALRSRALAGLLLASLALALLAAPACGNRKGKAPEWVLTAPAPTVMALSGSMGWLLEQPQFRNLLERFPLAQQSLDRFLQRARINPRQETGRISFYVLSAAPQPSDFLLQLGGFRDPASLNVALSEDFPAEGSLRVQGRELPLFVVLDLKPRHIRALVDPEGRVWLGDLGALARLDAGCGPDPIQASAQWINGGAPFQGFLKPQSFLWARPPSQWARDLPQGMDALVWSVTPGAGPNPLLRFELAITGCPDGIRQAAPWLQRLVAAASALQGGPAQAPEIIQEARRIGLRAQLTQEQLNLALAKLTPETGDGTAPVR